MYDLCDGPHRLHYLTCPGMRHATGHLLPVREAMLIVNLQDVGRCFYWCNAFADTALIGLRMWKELQIGVTTGGAVNVLLY